MPELPELQGEKGRHRLQGELKLAVRTKRAVYEVSFPWETEAVSAAVFKVVTSACNATVAELGEIVGAMEKRTVFRMLDIFCIGL